MRTYHLTFVAFAFIVLIAFGYSRSNATNQPKETALEQNGASHAPRYAYVPTLSPLFGANVGVATVADAVSDSDDIALAPSGQPANVFRTLSSEPAPEESISVGLVEDLKTEQMYWSLNADKRWPLASITKLVTGAFASNHVSTTQNIVLTDEVVSHLGDVGTSGLIFGQTYSAQDLMRAMLLFSSNESAEGLASSFGAEGRAGFLKGMNDLVLSWGAKATHFDDPTGLSVVNQSTATDIARIVKKVYEEYPDLLRITRTPKIAIGAAGEKKKPIYQNINEFAGRPDFIGGKTGFTFEAGGNLVSIFAYEGRPIIIVVLGAEDRFKATQSLLDWFKRTHSSRP